MKKRILALILTCLLCISLLPGCGDPSVEPLLYKVTDQTGNTAWLFGSIHAGKEYFYPLPDYVMSAFEGSDALAVEFDLLEYSKDYAAQTALIADMTYTDGTTIRDHISQETYEGAVEIMKRNKMYIPMLDTYKPILWYSYVETCAIQESGYSDQLGIDMHMLRKAKETGKEILEVESADFQMNMLKGFPEELQIYLLDSAVAGCRIPAVYKAGLDMMVEYWQSGDEANFSAYLNMSETMTSAQEESMMAQFNQAMITDRNDSMTRFAVEALESGKEVFICVGAAHVVGEGAMAQQLKDLGYTVEIVK